METVSAKSAGDPDSDTDERIRIESKDRKNNFADYHHNFEAYQLQNKGQLDEIQSFKQRELKL